jgi:hypothetical protein
MPYSLHTNTGAPSAGRLRSDRVAAGVVAEYIHDLSRPQHVESDVAPQPVHLSAAVGRVRTVRRRSHAPLSPRPLALRAGCPAA